MQLAVYPEPSLHPCEWLLEQEAEQGLCEAAGEEGDAGGHLIALL